MNPTPSVRQARATDSALIAGLLRELGYPVTPDLVPERLSRLAGDSRTAVLVAELGAEVVGLATVHLFDAVHADQPVALLTALVVTASARGSGVGRQLVEAAESFAREAGCGRIMVTTAEHRSGAHAFYQRLGWEYAGRRYAKRLLP